MGDISNIITGKIVRQNSQEFIIGVFTIRQVLKFTKYTSRLIVGYDENNLPIYNPEIQRFVETDRVEKIADFLILDPLATFPTNIVLGVPASIIESTITRGDDIEITINEQVIEEINNTNGNVYITIIDGQHRIRGIEVAIDRLFKDIRLLETIKQKSVTDEINIRIDKAVKRLEDLKNIQLVVSFFIDPSLEYQAMIFSTINRTQKKVSQNLVNSLFGLDVNDTPHKTALEITLSLNSHPSSPFFKRILLYGGTYDKNQSPPISQATMVRSIINLICENSREAEKDRHKNRKELLNRSASSNRYLPFRNYYANNLDVKISDILFYFFNAVKSTFINKNGQSYWDIDQSSSLSNILQTTVGYSTLLKIKKIVLDDSY